MANQPETATYDSGVYQWQTTDPVEGGTGGVANTPLLNLANRTGWLYNQVNTLAAEIATLAPINSPNFTGSPTVPMVAPGDNSTRAINSAFLQNALNGLQSVNCAGSANIILNATQYGAAIILLTGAVTAPISVIFPTQPGRWVVINRTTGSPVGCNTAGTSGIYIAQGTASTLICDGTYILPADCDYSRVYNLVSLKPALFSQGTFSDPDAGVTRDAKFGQSGIAVRGGTKSDTLNVTGLGTVNNLQANTGVGNNMQLFTGSGTWTCPANVFWVRATVTGGGGGGANSASSTPGNLFSGGGGGAGGTAIGVVAVTPRQTYTVTVGPGGGAQAGGGNSQFQGLIAYGGGAGDWNPAGNLSAGGSGGGATGGTVNIQGGSGVDGN